eukprot:TRINITY_DN7592_c0_g1_i1.p1 TRINITY_DN7592_c0_g1~~TRINITY_DN7592_c0_g1_i1.p1  ORF type:complete len:135 (-),score=49.23 TRINITY_DN7592_c0_g1_i1:45-449(-)
MVCCLFGRSDFDYIFWGIEMRALLPLYFFFFLMIRRPPRSTLSSSSAASDVYKRQGSYGQLGHGNEQDCKVPRIVTALKLKPVVQIACGYYPVSYTHLRAHETPEHLVCRLLLEKKKKKKNTQKKITMKYKKKT